MAVALCPTRRGQEVWCSDEGWGLEALHGGRQARERSFLLKTIYFDIKHLDFMFLYA